MTVKGVNRLYWFFMILVSMTVATEGVKTLIGPHRYTTDSQSVLVLNAAVAGMTILGALVLNISLARKGGLSAPLLSWMGRDAGYTLVTTLPFGYAITKLCWYSGFASSLVGALSHLFLLVMFWILYAMGKYLRVGIFAPDE